MVCHKKVSKKLQQEKRLIQAYQRHSKCNNGGNILDWYERKIQKLRANNRALAKAHSDEQQDCKYWYQEMINQKAELQQCQEQLLKYKNLQGSDFEKMLSYEVSKRLEETSRPLLDAVRSAMDIFVSGIESLTTVRQLVGSLTSSVQMQKASSKSCAETPGKRLSGTTSAEVPNALQQGESNVKKSSRKNVLHVHPMVKGHVLTPAMVTLPKVSLDLVNFQGQQNSDRGLAEAMTVIGETSGQSGNEGSPQMSNNVYLEQFEEEISLGSYQRQDSVENCMVSSQDELARALTSTENSGSSRGVASADPAAVDPMEGPSWLYSKVGKSRRRQKKAKSLLKRRPLSRMELDLASDPSSNEEDDEDVVGGAALLNAPVSKIKVKSFQELTGKEEKSRENCVSSLSAQEKVSNLSPSVTLTRLKLGNGTNELQNKDGYSGAFCLNDKEEPRSPSGPLLLPMENSDNCSSSLHDGFFHGFLPEDTHCQHLSLLSAKYSPTITHDNEDMCLYQEFPEVFSVSSISDHEADIKNVVHINDSPNKFHSLDSLQSSSSYGGINEELDFLGNVRLTRGKLKKKVSKSDSIYEDISKKLNKGTPGKCIQVGGDSFPNGSANVCESVNFDPLSMTGDLEEASSALCAKVNSHQNNGLNKFFRTNLKVPESDDALGERTPFDLSLMDATMVNIVPYSSKNEGKCDNENTNLRSLRVLLNDCMTSGKIKTTGGDSDQNNDSINTSSKDSACDNMSDSIKKLSVSLVRILPLNDLVDSAHEGSSALFDCVETHSCGEQSSVRRRRAASVLKSLKEPSLKCKMRQSKKKNRGK